MSHFYVSLSIDKKEECTFDFRLCRLGAKTLPFQNLLLIFILKIYVWKCCSDLALWMIFKMTFEQSKLGLKWAKTGRNTKYRLNRLHGSGAWVGSQLKSLICARNRSNFDPPTVGRAWAFKTDFCAMCFHFRPSRNELQSGLGLPPEIVSF